MIAGDPAQGQAFATGDAVVVAQRLEAAAPRGDPRVRVDDAPRAGCRHRRAGASARAEGKAETVVAWRLVDIDPAAAGFARRMDSPLVGRFEELALLRQELDTVVAERECRVVTIVVSPASASRASPPS